MLAKRIWFQLFGSLVSAAMSGKMKVNLYRIFAFQNGGPPEVGGPVQPNTSNMPKACPGPHSMKHWRYHFTISSIVLHRECESCNFIYCYCFRSYGINPAEEQFETSRYMGRPVDTVDRQTAHRPAGDIQQYQQRTLPGPGLMPKPFHGAPAIRDYNAQEGFLREIQQCPSRLLICVVISHFISDRAVEFYTLVNALKN